MATRSGTTRRRPLALLALLTLTALQLQLVVAGPASAQNSSCNGAFQGNPAGSLAMTANKANGATVAPGDTLTFTITWDTGDWSGLDQFSNCFAVNGTLDGSLTYHEQPPVNDGSIVHSITVPNNLADGDELCARARLSGQPTGGNTSTQKSNKLCFTIGSPPQGEPDVIVRKSSSVSSAVPGDEFDYTLTAENVGSADATNVVISDTIPSSLTIVSAAGCTTSGQTVTCDLGNLAQGAKKSVTIRVRTTPASCPDVDNFGIVSAGNEPGSNTGNNTSDTVTVDVICTEPGIAVRISKTNDANGDGIFSDNEEAKKEGEDVPFELVITNTGEETVRITDLTDAFDQTTLDLLDAKCSQLTGAELDPGESVTCTFTLANYSPPNDSPLDNTVEVCVRMVGGDLTDCDDDDSRVRSAVVLGRTITKTPPPGGTAFTGPADDAVRFGLLAIAMLLLGTGVLFAGYRRRARLDG